MKRTDDMVYKNDADDNLLLNLDSPPWDEDDDGDERYVLTPWGCLYSVLCDYGIDTEHISGRVGQHIVEDFMESMCKAGYIGEKDSE